MSEDGFSPDVAYGTATLTTFRGDILIVPCRMDLDLLPTRDREAIREFIVDGGVWSLAPPAELTYTVINVKLVPEVGDD